MVVINRMIFKLTEPPLLFGTSVPTLMPEICAGDNDGAFSITVTGGAGGGAGPYSVSLDAINGPIRKELLVKLILISRI
jgi:hypothetical protein